MADQDDECPRSDNPDFTELLRTAFQYIQMAHRYENGL